MLDIVEKWNSVATRAETGCPNLGVPGVHCAIRTQVTRPNKDQLDVQNATCYSKFNFYTRLLLEMIVKVAMTPHLFGTKRSPCDSVTVQTNTDVLLQDRYKQRELNVSETDNILTSDRGSSRTVAKFIGDQTAEQRDKGPRNFVS
jgi:hypothetical protein